MKTISALAFVGFAVAHKPVPYSQFAAAGVPPTLEVMGALGESYHNAWKYCHDKTTNFLFNDIGINEKDVTFASDANYYVEYKIKTRVPETYNQIKDFVGTYWDPPTFNDDGSILTYSDAPGQTTMA